MLLARRYKAVMRRLLPLPILFAFLTGHVWAAQGDTQNANATLLILLKQHDAPTRAASIENTLRERLRTAGIAATAFEALPALDAWLVHVAAAEIDGALETLTRARTEADSPLAWVESHGVASPPPVAPTLVRPPLPSRELDGLALALIDLGADSTHPLIADALGRLHYQPGAPGADGSNRLLRSHGTAMAGIYAQLASGVPLAVGELVLPWSRLAGGIAIDETLIARAGPETLAGRNELVRALDWLLTASAGHPRPDLINYSQGNGRLCDGAASCPAAIWTGVARLVDRLVDDGMLFVKSAGNHGYADIDTMTAPGDTYNGITVGNMHAYDWTRCAPSATRSGHKIYFTSSVGPAGGPRRLDLVAPGVRVTTAGVDPGWCRTQCRDDGDTPCAFCRRLGHREAGREGYWKTNSGTSPAAAVVGAVALRLRQAGLADPRLVKSVLINSAQSWSSDGAPNPRTRGDARRCTDDPAASRHAPWPWGSRYDRSYGWGYVDPPRALAEAPHARLAAIDGGDAVCWQTTLDAYDKLTLVWHRHAEVCADCGDWPPLAQLDLSLHAAAAPWSPLDRDRARSAEDNVAQVSNGRGPDARPVPRPVIARVSSAAANGRELFALASPRPLRRLDACPAALLDNDGHREARP